MSKQYYGVPVNLLKDIMIIKENLERMGISNRKTKIITPSCYIKYIGDKAFIFHFKELLAMDGYKFEISDRDTDRRNSIISMFVNWNMIDK